VILVGETLEERQATVIMKPTPPPRQRPRFNAGRAAGWAILILLIAITILPFYWMLRTGLSSNRALPGGSSSLLPVDPTIGAFRRVLGMATTEEALADGGSGASISFWLYLRNSVIFATTITVSQVVFSSMAAYAFARLRWPGRDALFFLFLTGLMIPPIFVFLPNFVLIRNLGLLNTFLGVMAPFLFMTPFAVFLLRQFFLTINREIEEAAFVDGAGHFTVFARIIVPMSGPALATLGILAYITAWNEYLWPLLVGSDENVRVLTVALGVFQSQTPQGSPDWAGLMAATFISSLPVMVIFALFGRKIVNSIQFTGIK
jgi:multiple sugar transport system permease protein